MVLLAIVFLALFMVLFFLSIFADRVLDKDELAQWVFGFSCFSLVLSLVFFTINATGSRTLLAMLGPSELLKTLAVLYFIIASGIGVMFLLALFTDTAEPWWYGFGALVMLVCSLVLFLGLVFFEWLAAILGIIATIIGILIGLKKLGSHNSEK